MIKKILFLLVAVTLLLQGCKNSDESPGLTHLKTHYRLVPNWLKLPKNFLLGNPAALAIDTAQNLVVFYRGGRTWPVLWQYLRRLLVKIQ
jgi:hypothetical protein